MPSFEEENKYDNLLTFEEYFRREGMIYINAQKDTLGSTGGTVAEYRVGCQRLMTCQHDLRQALDR